MSTETLSREALRAELGDLELRLVDRLTNALNLKADAKTVEILIARLNTLELSKAAREHLTSDVTSLDTRLGRLEDSFPTAADFQASRRDIDALKTWRSSVVGALTVISLVVSSTGLHVWFGVG